MRPASLQHNREVSPVRDVEDAEDGGQDDQRDQVDLAQGVLSELVAQCVTREHRLHRRLLRHDLVYLADDGSVVEGERVPVTQSRNTTVKNTTGRF